MHKEMEEKAAYVEKLNATAQLITQEYPLTEVQFTNRYSPPHFGTEQDINSVTHVQYWLTS